MHQMYTEIVNACEAALADFSKTQELLEYPEVQADKAYYLSVLKKYNALQRLQTKLMQLKSALFQEQTLLNAIADLSEEERAIAYEDLADLRNREVSLAEDLAAALGREEAQEKVFCRISYSADAESVCNQFYSLINHDLRRKADISNAVAEEGAYCFTAEGKNLFARLSVLKGVHKVYGPTTGEISLTVSPAPAKISIEEKHFKIDLFHSGGAGGQNINKVETAVRVTHIPTGTVVVCQDERSQLKNKRRALENIKARLIRQNDETEKKRMESDAKRQLKCISDLVFDKNGTYSDKRLAIIKQPFPPTQAEFTTYINALLAKE